MPDSTVGYSFDSGWGGEWFDPALLNPVREYDRCDGEDCTCTDVPCSCDDPTPIKENK